MPHFGPCTGPWLLVGTLLLVALFVLLIVWLGYLRLMRESGRHSAWALVSSMPLFDRHAFGKPLETPRRRIVALAGLAVFLLSIALLLAAAGVAVCR